MNDKPSSVQPRRAVSLADILFIFFTFAIMQHGTLGMLDDPGLGWHLRIADVMHETGGFIYTEPFCFASEGRPCVTKAWLGDIILRLSYAWGGMNGLVVVTSLVLAFMLRCLFVRMTAEGIPWVAAAFMMLIAAMDTSPAFTTRPNIFTLVGIVLVCQVCEHFHTGRIPPAKTLWLLPLFALWPNLHGGYLAGIVVLVVTYLVEIPAAIADRQAARRKQTRHRLAWLTMLAPGVFLATLLNPNHLDLHFWNLNMLTDPYLQTRTTTEWRPPDFSAQGWVFIELLILSFPVLCVASRRKPNALSVALCVVWLFFALKSSRYCPIWVLVATPMLAWLLCGVRPLRLLARRFVSLWSPHIQRWWLAAPSRSYGIVSMAFATLLMFVAPWLNGVAAHHPSNIPTASLDKFIDIYQGERIFHSADWGGYLTWHGWSKNPRLKTFIDDRIDVHGQERCDEYFVIIEGAPGWEEALFRHGVELACIPSNSRVTYEMMDDDDWREEYRDSEIVVFRRATEVSRQNNGADAL